jgi:alcohol dehydrogenase class IV
LFAIEAIRLAEQNFSEAVLNGEDLPAGTNMLFANALAGIAVAEADATVAYMVGDAVDAIYTTDYDTSVGLPLPAVIENNFVSNLVKYANLTRLLGEYRDWYSLMRLIKSPRRL